jgi:hypothetical protein
MKTQAIRSGRARAAAAALCGIATIATAACAAAAATVTVTAQQPTVADVAAASVPVVVDCAVDARTRPGQYNLACAGAGGYLSGLHWASWGPSAAFADGHSTLNDGHSFPVLVALWRAEPWPGHAGQRYFTRVTIIDTGSRTYRAGGTLRQIPLTATDPLSPFGGAGPSSP